MTRLRLPTLITWMMLGLLCLMVVSISLGQYPLRMSDIPGLLTGQGDHIEQQVFYELRLPRVLCAALVGAALSASGAAYQVLFRNPLVSPDILGVTTGAGLGAALGIFMGLSTAGMQSSAFLGGLFAVLAVGLLTGANRQQGNSGLILLLSGIVVGSLCGAMISMIKLLADPYNQLPAITFWLMGNLTPRSMDDVLLLAGLSTLGFAGLWWLRWPLNALSMGTEQAASLGISANRVMLATIVLATLLTASATSIAGNIAWVGLLVPHMTRLLVGGSFDRLLPVSIIGGALFLVGVDLLTRTLSESEIPAGLMTALLGAPCFLVLLLRRHNRDYA